MKISRSQNTIRRGGFVIVPLGLLVLVAAIGSFAPSGPATAYTEYSIAADATNCRFCHGDFRDTYTSLSDGQVWGEIHDLHRDDMLNNDCFACHINGAVFPVEIGASDGGTGLAPYGCVGCHGRAEDGNGTGTQGFGLAMQRRHEILNVGVDQNGLTCVACHTDALTRTPVGENVLPPYYANPGTNHPDMPTDPCNPPPVQDEDFAGITEGIDNDGDLVADQSDLDCVASTPGEASKSPLLPMLLVAGHDPVGGTMDLTYGSACGTTDNSLRFGPLADIAIHGYNGAECSILNTQGYTWSYPVASGSLFFVVVGNDGTVEGSYGLGDAGAERPSDPGLCTLTQDFSARCD